MKLRIFTAVLALCAALFTLGACGTSTTSDATTPQQPTITPITEENTVQTPWNSSDPYPVVTFTMENGGVITAELYPDAAPNTVHNFLSLVNQGYYDGKIFHRVIPNFMIQGGCVNGSGAGRWHYSIACETSGNTLRHEPGVLSMAHAGPNTGSVQFFIMHGRPAPHLDGRHTAFGRVIDGMDIVDQIANSPKGANDRPNNPPTIASATADAFGVIYPEPVTLPGR